MIHRCIDQLAAKAAGVAPLCRVLGVSRSGCYAAAARARKPASICAATVHLKTACATSGQSDGSRRLQQALIGEGRPIGRHRVRTLMRINRLRPFWKRTFIHTTDSRHTLPIADNLLNRQFEPARTGTASIVVLRRWQRTHSRPHRQCAMGSPHQMHIPLQARVCIRLTWASHPELLGGQTEAIWRRKVIE